MVPFIKITVLLLIIKWVYDLDDRCFHDGKSDTPTHLRMHQLCITTQFIFKWPVFQFSNRYTLPSPTRDIQNFIDSAVYIIMTTEVLRDFRCVNIIVLVRNLKTYWHIGFPMRCLLFESISIILKKKKTNKQTNKHNKTKNPYNTLRIKKEIKLVF